MKFLQSGLFAALAGLLLYVGTTAMLWPKLTPPPPPEAPKPAGYVPPLGITAPKLPSWDFSSPEMDELISELRREKEALATRSRELDELAARVQAERTELMAATQTVYQLQRDLDDSVIKLQDEEAGNLKKLAKVYGAMSPEGAATILTQLDEVAVVKILVYMKDDQRAAILETIGRLGESQARLAASISERLRLAVTRPPTPTKPKT